MTNWRHIYAWDLGLVLSLILFFVVFWAMIAVKACGIHWISRGLRTVESNTRVLWFLVCNIPLAFLSFYLIYRFTLWNRVASGVSIFMWMSSIAGEEFFREMFMNIFLYVPLGVFLPFALWGIVCCFAEVRKGKLSANKYKGVPCAACFLMSLLLACMYSCGIEYLQYVNTTGIAQFTDVLCNTLGAGIGGASFLIYRHGAVVLV